MKLITVADDSLGVDSTSNTNIIPRGPLFITMMDAAARELVASNWQKWYNQVIAADKAKYEIKRSKQEIPSQKQPIGQTPLSGPQRSPQMPTPKAKEQLQAIVGESSAKRATATEVSGQKAHFSMRTERETSFSEAENLPTLSPKNPKVEFFTKITEKAQLETKPPASFKIEPQSPVYRQTNGYSSEESILARGRNLQVQKNTPIFKDLGQRNNVNYHYSSQNGGDCDVVDCIPTPTQLKSDIVTYSLSAAGSSSKESSISGESVLRKLQNAVPIKVEKETGNGLAGKAVEKEQTKRCRIDFDKLFKDYFFNENFDEAFAVFKNFLDEETPVVFISELTNFILKICPSSTKAKAAGSIVRQLFSKGIIEYNSFRLGISEYILELDDIVIDSPTVTVVKLMVAFLTEAFFNENNLSWLTSTLSLPIRPEAVEICHLVAEGVLVLLKGRTNAEFVQTLVNNTPQYSLLPIEKFGWLSIPTVNPSTTVVESVSVPAQMSPFSIPTVNPSTTVTESASTLTSPYSIPTVNPSTTVTESASTQKFLVNGYHETKCNANTAVAVIRHNGSEFKKEKITPISMTMSKEAITLLRKLEFSNVKLSPLFGHRMYSSAPSETDSSSTSKPEVTKDEILRNNVFLLGRMMKEGDKVLEKSVDHQLLTSNEQINIEELAALSRDIAILTLIIEKPGLNLHDFVQVMRATDNDYIADIFDAKDGNSDGPSEAADGTWKCTRCTLLNVGQSRQCAACDRYLDFENFITCPGCTFYNARDRLKCEVCQTIL